MLKIITDSNLINGGLYEWDGLEIGDNIHNVDLDLNSGSPLMVTILADSRAKCSEVHNIRLPINFEKAGEKVLISPRKDGRWKGVIALQFSNPVFGTGAKIGVAGLGTPRPFRAMIRAYDTDGKECEGTFITSSTNKLDNSAIFLGAISDGNVAGITRIEFDAEPVIGSNLFAKFAINTLVYKKS